MSGFGSALRVLGQGGTMALRNKGLHRGFHAVRRCSAPGRTRIEAFYSRRCDRSRLARRGLGARFRPSLQRQVLERGQDPRSLHDRVDQRRRQRQRPWPRRVGGRAGQPSGRNAVSGPKTLTARWVRFCGIGSSGRGNETRIVHQRAGAAEAGDFSIGEASCFLRPAVPRARPTRTNRGTSATPQDTSSNTE
jgi:hypothetical protein